MSSKRIIRNKELYIKVGVDAKISISYKYVVLASYLYMIIPTIIFFFGWLKLGIALPATVVLLIGLFFLIKGESFDGIFEISGYGMALILIMAFLISYISGIGGTWPQSGDMHWRNAVIRDLIDYSWPIVYQKTDKALVYYFSYFLPSALVGKIFGWKTAQAFLVVFTSVGITFSIIHICKYLNIQSFQQVLVALIVFFIFRGVYVLRVPLIRMLGFSNAYLYDYTENFTLIRYVVNQVIMPWIAVPLFLNNRKISSYVYLGMCVFASAPLPFLGCFIFFAIDGVAQLFTKYDKEYYLWIKDVFSIPNICAMISIFPIFTLFYMCNNAATGQGGEGGFGLYVPIDEFSVDTFVSLATFLAFAYILYAVVLYRDNKKSLMYWIVVVSLLLIPFFRLGIGRDFIVRVSIPALYILMILIIRYVLDCYKGKINIMFIAMVGLITIAGYEFYSDVTNIYMVFKNGQPIIADRFETFAITKNSTNFLCDYSKDNLFFILAQEKKESDIFEDIVLTEKYMDKSGYSLAEGYYRIVPVTNTEISLLYDADTESLRVGEEGIFLFRRGFSESKYEIYDAGNDQQWTFISNERNIKMNYRDHAYADFDYPRSQIFELKKSGNYYNIVWNEENVLTYDNGEIRWENLNNGPTQAWKIVQIDKTDF